MPNRQTGSIERLFEYYEPKGDVKTILFNVEFSYYPGTRHSHPGGHWNSHIGSWDPPDDPECEMGDVTRQDTDGRFIPVTPADWFWNAWVIPLWDSLETSDFVEAMGV